MKINKYLVHNDMKIDVVDAEDFKVEGFGNLIFLIGNQYYKAFAQGHWNKVSLCKQPISGIPIPNPLEHNDEDKRSILRDCSN